jgi:hypothetical protein
MQDIHIYGAEREFRESIDLYAPPNAQAHCSTGGILMNLHQRQYFDGAGREFRARIAAAGCDPQDVGVLEAVTSAHFGLGLLLMQTRQDFDGTEHALRMALRYAVLRPRGW